MTATTDTRLGNLLIFVGVAILVVGLVVRFAPWVFSWFGRLPGDIRYESDTTRVYIPFTSMIVASVVLTILVNVLRLFRE